MQQSDERKGVFADFSMNAILVSALAAGTSFFLTSKIGLTGSLVGAIFAAIVSTGATQVYKGALSASTDKIKDVVESSDEELVPSHGKHRHMATATTREAYDDQGSSLARKLIIFSVIVSLVCVAVSAAIVYASTKGQGLGPTSVDQIVTSQAPASDNQTDADAQTHATDKDKKSQQQTEASTTDSTGDTTQNTDASQGTTGTSSTSAENTAPDAANTDAVTPSPTDDANVAVTDDGAPDASSGTDDASGSVQAPSSETDAQAPAEG